MRINLIDKELPQYKANLHAHTTYSDGNFTPLQVKEHYKANGYRTMISLCFMMN